MRSVEHSGASSLFLRAMHRPLFILVLVAAAATSSARAEKLHFTYLWHLEQPTYWPDRQAAGADRYERAWESIQRKDGGAVHPENNLREIFGLADRVAIYQYRARDSINAIRSYPGAGAQISYSGCLVENIQSLGGAGQLGYSSAWFTPFREARAWATSRGKPRCDLVIFPFHHPLLPLCDESAVRKEIQLYKLIYPDAWGTSPALSRGMFPSEMAFSERLIPVLASEGVDWVFVSAEKISRANVDFPVVLGSGGVNCDPPNRADQLNPAQSHYYRVSISRGCGPAEAYPQSFTPHRAQYVNPETGAISRVIVVPCSQSLGWKDGYAPLGLGDFNALQTRNDPARPMLAVLAHDGDNAWGGGYSYYQEATPNLVQQAQGAGYVASTVEHYLGAYPVPADDIVHVEDGAWVNADGDFGSPMMLNWNWPLVSASGQIDIPGGWAEDERNWAVITAAQNRVDTAEQIAGGVNLRKILHPDASTTDAERAWHYFLGALNSGYMYYGAALDMEVKPTIACNRAVAHANAVIGSGSADATPPTVWIPQRHPWNPGSLNFGPQYGYRQVHSNGDFWVWTFVHDVSGVASVNVKYRVDADGTNPLASTQNETYAGGAEVGSWQTLAMTRRVFPAGNVLNDPEINFFVMPTYIADQYHVQVTGLRSVLIDYYVEATDTRGHVRRSPIQHVYIGDGSGGGGPGTAVTLTPDPAVAGQQVTVRYNPEGRVLASATQVYLHYGFSGWSPVVSPDPPMTWNATDRVWTKTVSIPSSASALDLVFNNGAGVWDNNSGQDWHFAVTGGQPADTWTMDGQLDPSATQVSANGATRLYAGLKGDVLYVAGPAAGGGYDRFILIAQSPGALRSPMWAKGGQVAGWSAYLANENDNNYRAWSSVSSVVESASTPGAMLEGTINLRHEFGQVPTTIYIALLSYATADGGALSSSLQVPPSVNGDGNLDATEYALVNLCSLTTTRESADLDLDCDVDAADFDGFAQCSNGSGFPPAATCAAGVNADLDGDGDVDQCDFGLLQRCLNTPGFFARAGCSALN